MYLVRGDSLTALEANGQVYVPQRATCIVTGANDGLGMDGFMAFSAVTVKMENH